MSGYEVSIISDRQTVSVTIISLSFIFTKRRQRWSDCLGVLWDRNFVSFSQKIRISVISTRRNIFERKPSEQTEAYPRLRGIKEHKRAEIDKPHERILNKGRSPLRRTEKAI